MPEVLSVDLFGRSLERERMRADRTAGELSLLLLDVSGGEWRTVPLQEPLLAFLHRVRLSDEVGWYDLRTIGVLLPETGAAGAHQVAAALQELLEPFGILGSWRVYTYPGTWTPSDPGGGGFGTGASRRGGGRSAMGRPTPVRGSARSQEEVGTEAAAPRSRTAQAEKAPGPIARAESISEPLRPLFNQHPSWLKRGSDIIGGALGLILMSPIMLVAAVLVWCTSPGPIIFRQTRVGLGGRHFGFYKFRTMYIDAEERKKELEDQNEASGPVFKMKNDPRMTPIGKLLRKASIDELPQLWNVLIGDMSLVGPRPPVPQEVEVYDDWQRRRLEVPGGLTCIWQVSGRSEIAFEEWVRMDIRYGRKMGFWYDMTLLIRTIPAVFTGRGAL